VTRYRSGAPGDVHVECWPGATAGAYTLRMITINNSYDTTAATAAAPTTASAVDHLITRSVASPPATADQRELGHEHAMLPVLRLTGSRRADRLIHG
jgi:hypothetical protein